MEKLTKQEKRALKRLGVSKKDLHITGHNCVGTIYGLYNDYWLCQMTCYGWDTDHVYRVLARKLLNMVGIVAEQ